MTNQTTNSNYDPEIYRKLPTAADLPKLRELNDKFEEQKIRLKNIIQLNMDTKPQELDIEQKREIKDFSLCVNFLNNAQKELFSLPFISDTNSTCLDDHQQQLVLLKFFKTIFLTVMNTEEWIDEKDIKTIRKFISELSKCSIKFLVNDSDFDKLDIWIKEVVECQQLFRKYLPLFKPEQGTSKGILFKILKNGEIRGWLFGTMHALSTPELRKVTNLCEGVYKRLLNSAIIATEIKVANGTLGGDSVENHLIQCAMTNGIINLGMDSEERDADVDFKQVNRYHFLKNIEIDERLVDLAIGNEELQNQIKGIIENKKKITQLMNEIALAYHDGNSPLFSELCEGVSKDEQTTDIDIKRQDALIKNTHACLMALEKVKTENAQIPKGFFAYGTQHLLDHIAYPKTIVEGLIELGWDVQPDS